jgi:hypothetical protein
MTTLDLSQFTGTEAYHRTFMFNPKLVHTDGVQYFADTAGCFWFLDIVATEIFELTKKEPFLAINMLVEDGQAKIAVEDGDLGLLFSKHIEHTDCPSGLYEFFLTDNVLMLTSEY